MTMRTHCDGPGCDKSKVYDEPRRLCDERWTALRDGYNELNFCSRTCIGRWANT